MKACKEKTLISNILPRQEFTKLRFLISRRSGNSENFNF